MKPDYTRSIVNLTSSVLNHYGLIATHPSLNTLDDALTDDIKHVIVAVLDGLGVNGIERHLHESTLFRRFMADKITSVFPSTTTAATTAILTGLTPYESGFLGWFQYFRAYDTHYTVFLGEDYYHPQKPIHLDFKTMFDRPTFIDRIKQVKGVDAKILMPFPIDKSGFHSMNEGLEQLKVRLVEHDRTLTYFYLVEPDLTQHLYGASSVESKRMFEALNEAFTAFSKTLSKDTLVILTADHGLTDVEPIDLFSHEDLIETFAHLPAIEPRATTFFIKEGRHEDFERLFDTTFGTHFTLYNKVSLLNSGLLGHGVKHPFVDLCLGDYMAIAKDKYYFALSNDKHHKGHHAGLSEDEMVVPLILFRGAS